MAVIGRNAVSARAIGVVSMLALACAQQQPSHAATASYRFVVSATVLASCSIDVTALLAHAQAAVGAASDVCARAAAPAGIPAPKPTVTLVNDTVAGISRLTIEF